MDERQLRERVHGALQAADSDPRRPRTPAFAALWQAAQQPVERRPRWHMPALAAGVAVAAVAVIIALRLQPAGDGAVASADADLLLAQQLAASEPWRVPTDRLLAAAPASLASGAPSIPDIRYPLLPKERYL